jgi:hypothetical protein
VTNPTIILVNVADLPDPNDSQGRSYRQVNAAKTHKIPVGTLVEIETGARLFVVFQGRDCDQEPLYWLSPEADDTERADTRFGNRLWIGGYGEDSLTVVGVGAR